MAVRRKLWSLKSMREAVLDVERYGVKGGCEVI